MKLTLGILIAYSMMDVLLTAVGLSLGLGESNAIVRMYVNAAGIVLGLILHSSITILLFSAIFVALCWVEEHLLDFKHVTRFTISLITVFYVCVLIHNLYLIWRYM